MSTISEETKAAVNNIMKHERAKWSQQWNEHIFVPLSCPFHFLSSLIAIDNLFETNPLLPDYLVIACSFLHSSYMDDVDAATDGEGLVPCGFSSSTSMYGDDNMYNLISLLSSSFQILLYLNNTYGSQQLQDDSTEEHEWFRWMGLCLDSIQHLLSCISLITNMDCICEILLYICNHMEGLIHLLDDELSSADELVIEQCVTGMLKMFVHTMTYLGISHALCEDVTLFQALYKGQDNQPLTLMELCSSQNYVTSYLLKNGYRVGLGTDSYQSVFLNHGIVSVAPFLDSEVKRFFEKMNRKDIPVQTSPSSAKLHQTRRTHGQKLLFEPESDDEDEVPYSERESMNSRPQSAYDHESGLDDLASDRHPASDNPIELDGDSVGVNGIYMGLDGNHTVSDGVHVSAEGIPVGFDRTPMVLEPNPIALAVHSPFRRLSSPHPLTGRPTSTQNPQRIISTDERTFTRNWSVGSLKERKTLQSSESNESLDPLSGPSYTTPGYSSSSAEGEEGLSPSITPDPLKSPVKQDSRSIPLSSRRTVQRAAHGPSSLRISSFSSDDESNTPSTAQSLVYQSSFFDLSPSVVTNEVKDPFVSTFNVTLLSLLGDIAAVFPVSYQIQCVREVLTVYNDYENVKHAFLNYLYIHWIHCYIMENHPNKGEVLTFMLEVMAECPFWCTSISCRIEASLLTILEKCHVTLDEYSENLFMNEWSVLLSIYKLKKDKNTFKLLSSLLSYFLSSNEFCADTFSMCATLGLSAFQVLTPQHAEMLFIGKARYIITTLKDRANDLDEEALDTISFFILWLVENDRYDVTVEMSLLLTISVLLGKRALVLLDMTVTASPTQEDDKGIPTEHLKTILTVIGQIDLTLVKRNSSAFQEELNRFEELDRRLIQYCCCEYVQSKTSIVCCEQEFHRTKRPNVVPFVIELSRMPNYYFLVGSVSFVAGLYIDQNYNVPDIKYWVKHATELVRSLF